MKNRSVFSLLIVAAMMLAALSPTSAATRLQQKDVNPVVHEVSEVLLDMPIEPPSDLWTAYETASAKNALGESAFKVIDDHYSVFALDLGRMDAVLANVPAEFSTLEKRENYQVTLPMPDGTLQRFRIWDSPIMEAPLAAEYPEIRTYVGQGVDDPTATVRFDRTPEGFHGQVLSAGRSVYIDPYRSGDTSNYLVYDKRGLQNVDNRMTCLFDTVEENIDPESQKRGGGGSSELTNSGTLRIYRLAMAATGEYTAARGGTVASAMSSITTTVNRVTGIYERELAIRLVLIANNSSIVYTNASTDPYPSGSPNGTFINTNQSNIDSVIGSANYDIGHVVTTGDGGVAGLGVVCVSGQKGRGGTGRPSPVGDAFDVDYVAHEMGHQFGGNHTFNGDQGSCTGGNRNANTAYEPGSGTTIQAYAGICGTDNVQANSNDYFHSESLKEMIGHAAGQTCNTSTSTGNSAPTVTLPANFTIPQGTPFTLTATASDPNGDALTYCWEQRDLGLKGNETTQPLFRSLSPSTSPSRTFPQMSSVLAGSNTTTWEKTPVVNRTMKFTCAVRDNRAGGGAFALPGTTGTSGSITTVTITVSGAAFSVSSPNTAVSWAGNSTQTVTWNAGGTASYAPNVNILVSTDGGSTWSTVAANTPNDGSQAITVPNTPSSTCRIKVEGAGNIFFDVSNANFTITAGTGCTYSISPTSVSPAAGATTGTVSVTAGTGCAWTATSNAAWLTITSGASGSGNGTVGYSVAANSGAARSGTLTIAGQTFTVNQAAAASCTYSISPTSSSPAAGATTGTVSVTAGAGCAWTATSNAPWLTITSGASGTGNGSVGYSVAANTGAARNGTMTIAGATFTVNQAAATTGVTPIACGASASGSLASTDGRSNVRGSTYYADVYSFTPAASGSTTIALNASFDTYLYLKSTATGSTALTQDDDSGDGTNSLITYTVTAGTTYFIEATSYDPNTAGSYTLALTCPSVVTELVTNGGFETGAMSPWVAATYSTVTTGSPQAGTYKAQMLGQGTTASTNFYQPIAGFNGTTKTLRFWLKMSSTEGTTTAYDYLYVRIRNTSGGLVTTTPIATYTNRNKTAYTNWTLVTLTIPATALSNYRISFEATEDSTQQTTFFIDSVSIQ